MGKTGSVSLTIDVEKVRLQVRKHHGEIQWEILGRIMKVNLNIP